MSQQQLSEGYLQGKEPPNQDLFSISVFRFGCAEIRRVSGSSTQTEGPILLRAVFELNGKEVELALDERARVPVST
jgi:hypothetical protein